MRTVVFSFHLRWNVTDILESANQGNSYEHIYPPKVTNHDTKNRNLHLNLRVNNQMASN